MGEPDDDQGNVCECGSFEIESWEGQLNNDNNSNEKTPDTSSGKETVQDAIGKIRVRVRGLGAVVRQSFDDPRQLQSQHEGFVASR